MNRSPDKANPFKRRGAGFLARDEVSSSFFFLLSVRGRKKFPSNDAYNILCGHKDLLKFPEIANLFERDGIRFRKRTKYFYFPSRLLKNTISLFKRRDEGRTGREGA